MADQDDINIEKMIDDLRDYYTGLVVGYLRLPIPIALPTEINSFTEVMASVFRAYELLNDQPLPEEVVAVLTATTLHWISAAELMVNFVVHGKEAIAHAALLNMFSGQPYLMDFIHWTDTGHLPED